MRIDLERYILMLADQSIQMRKEMEKINEAAKTQELQKEAIENFQRMVDTVESNYQRVLYCKYLLDLKPKWIRDLIDKRAKKKALEFAEKKADQQSVIEENKGCLDKVREFTDGQD